MAVVLVHDQKKNFYKKFLYEPFPVESSLLEVLADHLNAEIVAGMEYIFIFIRFTSQTSHGLYAVLYYYIIYNLC